MTMTAIFASFATLFAFAGWLMPHDMHRLGFRMSLFYLVMAAFSAILALVRPSRSR